MGESFVKQKEVGRDGMPAFFTTILPPPKLGGSWGGVKTLQGRVFLRLRHERERRQNIREFVGGQAVNMGDHAV